jgi:hypothetical protein
MQRKILGTINMVYDATGQLLAIYSAVVQYKEKIGIKYSSASALYRLQSV